jgi:hypothetical protein
VNVLDPLGWMAKNMPPAGCAIDGDCQLGPFVYVLPVDEVVPPLVPADKPLACIDTVE